MKSYTLLYGLLILCLSFQCRTKDQSPISFRIQGDAMHFENEKIRLVFDELTYCKVELKAEGLVQSMNHSGKVGPYATPPHFIKLDGIIYKDFKTNTHKLESLEDTEYGTGKRLTLEGSDRGIERSLIIEMYDQYPDVAQSWCTYTNRTGKDVEINEVYYNYYRVDRKLTNPSAVSYDYRYLQPLNKQWGDTWTNLGIADSTKEDFIIPGSGINRSGISFIDVWGPEMGMGIFHVEAIPRFHHIILKVLEDKTVAVGFKLVPEDSYGQMPELLKNNQSFTTWKSAICPHKNDFFTAGRRYGQFLDGALIKEGLEGLPDEYPAQAYEPYWKTWGMNDLAGSPIFTLEQVRNKMDELADYGFKAIMLDDGWQNINGLWDPDVEKFDGPQGMIDFVTEAHKPKWGKSENKSFKVYLWFDLLGTDTITNTIEPLLVRNEDGTVYQSMNTKYTLCPSFKGTQDYIRDSLLDKIINNWNVDGLYTDLKDQNPLPCFNKGHRHSLPAESVENNHLAFSTMHDEIMRLKPETGWISMCACASVHDAYQYPYYFVSDASDPTSNKQVRWRTRWIKAFRGSTAPVGDGYVDKMDYDNKAGEPAMSIALGNVITSVRWDVDELGGAGHVKKWMNLFFNEKLYEGEYLGLYDIQYHKPEGYVIRQQNGVVYFAFFDEQSFDKEVELRGLARDVAYEIIEYDTDVNKGTVEGNDPQFHITSKPGNHQGEQVFYYVIKCIPLSKDQ